MYVIETCNQHYSLWKRSTVSVVQHKRLVVDSSHIVLVTKRWILWMTIFLLPISCWFMLQKKYGTLIMICIGNNTVLRYGKLIIFHNILPRSVKRQDFLGIYWFPFVYLGVLFHNVGMFLGNRPSFPSR